MKASGVVAGGMNMRAASTLTPSGTVRWRSNTGGRVAENLAWNYAEPSGELAPLNGHLTFYWSAVDAWFEEDEEVFVHPRDPYSRVDTVHSSRQVRVEVEGQVIAESSRPVLLYETGLPTPTTSPSSTCGWSSWRGSTR